MIRTILALNCLLQVEQVNSEHDNSDDDPLALALRFCSASQTETIHIPNKKTKLTQSQHSITHFYFL